MSLVELECDFCGCLFKRRAIFLELTGPHIFCSRPCFWMARRKFKSDKAKRAEKAAYDRIYREKNRRMLKAKKRAYFQRTYDPVQAAIVRQKRMPQHVEYCRQPSYRRKKKRYDEKRRDRLQYGDYGKCFRLLQRLEGEVGKRMSDYEIRLQQGTLNKKQIRARALQNP